jgi:hypothetical protein
VLDKHKNEKLKCDKNYTVLTQHKIQLESEGEDGTKSPDGLNYETEQSGVQ